MAAFLFLGHFALAVFLVCFVGADQRTRANAAALAGCTGALLGVLMVFERHAQLAWRTTELHADQAVIAGGAIACAWLLVAILPSATRMRPEEGALVGVGAGCLALFAATDWIVPALLFWVASSVAIAATGLRRRGRAPMWILLALSDAAFVAGTLWVALDKEVWQYPAAITGSARWILIVAAVVRAGVLPRIGPWAVVGSPPSASTPLVVGGGFLIIVNVVRAPAIGIGLALLVAAIAIALWGVLRTRVGIDRIAPWAPSVFLAIALVSPRAAAQAGLAAIVTCTALCLWPFARGRAQLERGFMLALIPATAGFGAVVAAASASFAASNGAPSTLRSVPWAAFAALLPAAVACGVALGTRLGRVPEPEAYAPYAVIATWVLFGVSLLLGVLPPGALGDANAGPGRAALLGAVAIMCGALTFRFDPGGASEGPVSERRLEIGPVDLTGVIGRAAVVVAGVLFVTSAGATLWLTYKGLTVGFL